MLRRRLYTLRPHGGTVLITSPNPGEGKTLTSVNLAWSLADAGHDTCLVDLDFRAPGVSRTLGCLFEEDGVEDMLTGKEQSANQFGNWANSRCMFWVSKTTSSRLVVFFPRRL